MRLPIATADPCTRHRSSCPAHRQDNYLLSSGQIPFACAHSPNRTRSRPDVSQTFLRTQRILIHILARMLSRRKNCVCIRQLNYGQSIMTISVFASRTRARMPMRWRAQIGLAGDYWCNRAGSARTSTASRGNYDGGKAAVRLAFFVWRPRRFIGIDTDTVVPCVGMRRAEALRSGTLCAGLPWILTLPPKISARSCKPDKPSDS